MHLLFSVHCMLTCLTPIRESLGHLCSPCSSDTLGVLVTCIVSVTCMSGASTQWPCTKQQCHLLPKFIANLFHSIVLIAAWEREHGGLSITIISSCFASKRHEIKILDSVWTLKLNFRNFSIITPVVPLSLELQRFIDCLVSGLWAATSK